MANNEKTAYETPCPFACDFCENRVIEVRYYKGNEKCGKYGYAKCGNSIRPPKNLADKILAKRHSEKVHSDDSTMQSPRDTQTVDKTCEVREKVHSEKPTIHPVEKETQEFDFFEMLGGK